MAPYGGIPGLGEGSGCASIWLVLKLNHVNLTVDDVTAARGVLEKHFGLRPEGEPHRNFALLRDDDGLVLTLMGAGQAPVEYPRTFHIGFVQPSKADVDEIHRQLRGDGFDVQPPQQGGHGYTFYFRAPGGFLVEILGP